MFSASVAVLSLHPLFLPPAEVDLILFLFSIILFLAPLPLLCN